jgi:hypothetical protein
MNRVRQAIHVLDCDAAPADGHSLRIRYSLFIRPNEFAASKIGPIINALRIVVNPHFLQSLNVGSARAQSPNAAPQSKGFALHAVESPGSKRIPMKGVLR